MYQQFLSDVELYFTNNINTSSRQAVIVEDEAKHIITVMRHKEGDIIYTTDGSGVIYKTKISGFDKKQVVVEFVEEYKYENTLANFTICIPRLKVQDRFEFAFEKCIELGFTNFIVFESDRGVSRGAKTDKWEKKGIAAMKQALRAYLPQFGFSKKIDEILAQDGDKYFFDQNADVLLKDNPKLFGSKKSFIIFGPEGGFSEREYELIKQAKTLKLCENRLRSETAVITAASLISLHYSGM